MCHNKHLQWFQDTSNTTKIIHINGHNSVEEVMEYVKTITAKLIDEKQNQK
jgi:hypothetical protein